MATVETIRPTRHVEHDPTGTNLHLAYDSDDETWANLVENTEGSLAVVTWDDFPDGAILPTKRESVILRIKAGYSTTDPNDKISIYARAQAADPFTLMQYAKYPGTFSPPAYVDVDVTDLLGVEPLSSLDVQVIFGNGASGDPDNPDPPLPHA